MSEHVLVLVGGETPAATLFQDINMALDAAIDAGMEDGLAYEIAANALGWGLSDMSDDEIAGIARDFAGLMVRAAQQAREGTTFRPKVTQ